MTLSELYTKAKAVWVPHWFDLFYDPAVGAFHERLDKAGTPLDMPRRLVSQCRQIMVYAEGGDTRYTSAINSSFDYIERHLAGPIPGSYVFAENDRHFDLYGLTFMISACAATGRNAQALNVLDFIEMHMAMPLGFAEKIGMDLAPIPQKRRQNPHMHLLEAVQSMALVSDNPRWLKAAQNLRQLFFTQFFQNGFLYEFFDDDLNAPSDWIEAGHHAEWIWLLHRFGADLGNPNAKIPAAKHVLYAQALKGWDDAHGGIFNAQNTGAKPIDDNKRIWPLTEMLRAARIMADLKTEKALISLLQEKYITPEGIWTESWNRDFSAAQDYLPATTPYHIFLMLASLKA